MSNKTTVMREDLQSLLHSQPMAALKTWLRSKKQRLYSELEKLDFSHPAEQHRASEIKGMIWVIDLLAQTPAEFLQAFLTDTHVSVIEDGSIVVIH